MSEVVVYTAFLGILTALAWIDWRHMILPDVLTLPGSVLALGCAPLIGLSWTESLWGGLLGFGVFRLCSLYFPHNLGQGDAKLMLLLGALCGLKGLPVVLTTGTASGFVFALASRRQRIPFGPFLCLGAMLHILGGRPC